ncbi:nacht and ankyrin domain protein [Colletotrichum asianum]|uniref:Nacht and ankyrin domain protein n=1 Tax=Colletotrichum asianum TaxID=702518 RepID=A0A8H3W494_9PEZI|nr:nacht and ankyrin domain protein [Colletotrichum asianum]
MSRSKDSDVSSEGFTVLHDPLDANIDLIFVHGLGGHPFSTWAIRKPKSGSDVIETPDYTKAQRPSFLSSLCCFGTHTEDEDKIPADNSADSSGAIQLTEMSYWPRDLLAESPTCANVRVLTYGYDFKVTKGFAAANQNNLFAHARDLLYALQRKKPQRRPVIFVAHSLGGLLVKEVTLLIILNPVLRRSHYSDETELRDIIMSTKGVMFLGTPHRGSQELAKLGETVRSIAAFTLRIDSNSELLRALGTESPELELGREAFLTLWRIYNFRVKTFREAYGISGVNVGPMNQKVSLPRPCLDEFQCQKMLMVLQVVPDISSTLDDPREHAETIPANHMDMCRFNQKFETGYQKISGELDVMIGMCDSGLTISDAGKELLQSLYFPEMYDRQKNIQTALDTTCDWLYTTSEYQGWINRTNVPQHEGMLWIKGKPGTGKSTLMKDALGRAEAAYFDSRTTTVAGFFFNARGTQQLEKSPLGLYRSLLHQVLQQDLLALSHASEEFKRKQLRQGVWVWHEADLQDILASVFATAHSRPAMIFIDAMDECNIEQVRGLVRFFRALARKAHQAAASLNICLSSRHYPDVSIDGCPEVVVERNNENDILAYIVAEAENEKAIAELKDDIFHRSTGVFLWVVLVVAILKKHCRGKSSKWLQKKLHDIPPELDILFRTIFTSTTVEDAEQTTRLMQAILFAEQPLTLSQIHMVLAFGSGSYRSIAEWKDSVEYLETTEKRHSFIIETSRGLLEATVSSTEADEPKMPSEQRTYQFIHETVREFYLTGEGFKLLDFETPSIVGSGHSMLAAATANYLGASEFADRRTFGSFNLELMAYTADHIFTHIDKAEKNHIAQTQTLASLGEESCILLRRMSRTYDGPTAFEPGATILMAAIMYGAIDAVRRLLDTGHSTDERGFTSLRYPLHTALCLQRGPMLEIVGLLLSRGADISLTNGFKQTPLHFAAMAGTEATAVTLAHSPEVNATDVDGKTPLLRAYLSSADFPTVVSMLIKHGADTSIKDNEGKTPSDTASDYFNKIHDGDCNPTSLEGMNLLKVSKSNIQLPK